MLTPRMRRLRWRTFRPSLTGTGCGHLLSIFRGTLFKRRDRVSTSGNSGGFHHWVVLLDPVDVDGEQHVLWVSQSSFKSHLDRSQTYVFKDPNKYLDGRNESSPLPEIGWNHYGWTGSTLRIPQDAARSRRSMSPEYVKHYATPAMPLRTP